MDALFVALFYVVPFVVIGFVAKRLIHAWMARKCATLADIHATAGPNRHKGPRFLLGILRRAD